MGCVYKITNNLTQKVYIGYTTRTLQVRWMQHVHDAYNKNNSAYDNYLKRAIRKYNESNFSQEALEYSDDKQYLQKREQYWIKYYHSFAGWPDSNGYNLTTGGDGGNGQYKMVYKINPITGKVEEIFFSATAAVKKYGYSVFNILYNPTRKLLNRGYTFYFKQEFDKYNSTQQADIVRTRYNPICQLSLNGQLINMFLNYNQVEEQTGFDKNNIQAAITRKNLSYDYQWTTYKFLKERLDKPLPQLCQVSVDQYDLDNNFIQTFNSAKDAAKAINQKDSSSIIKVCKGKRRQCGGFIWKYHQNNIRKSNKIKAVLCYSKEGQLLGKYENASIAAREMHLPSSQGISKCLRNKQKSAYGYIWKEDDNEVC